MSINKPVNCSNSKYFDNYKNQSVNTLHIIHSLLDQIKAMNKYMCKMTRQLTNCVNKAVRKGGVKSEPEINHDNTATNYLNSTLPIINPKDYLEHDLDRFIKLDFVWQPEFSSVNSSAAKSSAAKISTDKISAAKSSNAKSSYAKSSDIQVGDCSNVQFADNLPSDCESNE